MVLSTGRAGNLAVMMAKRFVLLLLGFAGSVLAAGLLYISANGIKLQTSVITEEPTRSFTMPVTVSGTELIAQRLSAYEGPFLEDGTDREVVDIAALHIYNPTDKEILKTSITLYWEQQPYMFYGEHIPPASTVILLEKSANPYRSDMPIACSGWQELSEDQSVSGIVVTEISMGTVAVTNMSGKPLKNLQLYYKTWLSPPGFYMGGIAYSTQLPELLPGQTENLQPYHYAKGYSKIVSITADP